MEYELTHEEEINRFLLQGEKLGMRIVHMEVGFPFFNELVKSLGSLAEFVEIKTIIENKYQGALRMRGPACYVIIEPSTAMSGVKHV